MQDNKQGQHECIINSTSGLHGSRQLGVYAHKIAPGHQQARHIAQLVTCLPHKHQLSNKSFEKVRARK